MKKIILLVAAFFSFCFAANAQTEIKKEYYTNGKIQKEIPYLNGKKNGLEKWYYAGGKVKLEKHYTNDELISVKASAESGNAIFETQYKGGLKNGSDKLYYPSGILKTDYLFVNDKQNGICKGYYESGKLKTETFYVDDKANGIGKTYFESGVLKSEAILKDNVLNGLYKKFYENGKIMQEVVMKDGNENGLLKEYDENGKLTTQTNYDNGVISENSKKETITQAQPKIEKTYYPTGELNAETYKNNNGIYLMKVYFKTGILAKELPYVNGKWDGIVKEYYENGNLKTEAYYVKNERIGIATEYTENGKVIPLSTKPETCKCCNGTKGSKIIYDNTTPTRTTSVKQTYESGHEGDNNYATGRITTTTTTPNTKRDSYFQKCTCCKGKGKVATTAASRGNIEVSRDY